MSIYETRRRFQAEQLKQESCYGKEFKAQEVKLIFMKDKKFSYYMQNIYFNCDREILAFAMFYCPETGQYSKHGSNPGKQVPTSQEIKIFKQNIEKSEKDLLGNSLI